MGLFYIHHRWLNFIRKGDHLKILVAIFILAMFVFRLGNAFLGALSIWVTQLSEQYAISEVASFKFIFVMFLIGMTAIKLFIDSAPLHFEPYRLWPVNQLSLSLQYVLLSHLKPANFFWLFSEVVMLIKAAEFGIEVLPIFIAFWLMQHYLNILLRPYPVIKWTILSLLFLLTAICYKGWLGFGWVDPILQLTPVVGIFAITALILAVLLVQKRPEAFLRKEKLASRTFLLGGVDFADPLFDLEVKLIWRNKGTRTNLIFGFLAIPVLLYYFGNAGAFAGVYFMAIITTGLVLLQHGIYTMSWEGNYFDLLVTRFSALEFMHFKFRFYFLATFIGLIFSSIALFIDATYWLPLLAAFFYNISWNCFVVLNGVLGNKKKLELGQNIVFKSESMTANVLTVSFMTIILPMLLFGMLSVFLSGDMAYYGVIGFSVIGLMLKDPVLKRIADRMENKKYNLSTAFHD